MTVYYSNISCTCREASSLIDPTDGMETIEEQRVHSPPASLVPRLHMLCAQPLVHNNPLLPSGATEDNGDCKTVLHLIFVVCAWP